MTDSANNPLLDLFPVPQKFMDIILEFCDKDHPASSTICGQTYLKRIAELGALDLEGFCGKLNYVFFTGNCVFTSDTFGEHTVGEVVDAIKRNSVLGSVLK